MIEIKNFTICAERDTGTNYMQRLIPQAFGINMTWDYGPKHFMGWHDSDLVDAHNTLCICMVRNPYDWLMALFKTKHHVPYGSMRDTFKSFATSEWYSIHHGNRHPDHGKERTDDRYWVNGERHKNIFEMRKRKLYYIKHDIPSKAPNHYHVRYEDLCNNTEGVVQSISETFNLEIKNTDYEAAVKKEPYEIKHGQFNLINEHTDWEAEALFDYTINRRSY